MNEHNFRRCCDCACPLTLHILPTLRVFRLRFVRMHWWWFLGINQREGEIRTRESENKKFSEIQKFEIVQLCALPAATLKKSNFLALIQPNIRSTQRRRSGLSQCRNIASSGCALPLLVNWREEKKIVLIQNRLVSNVQLSRAMVKSLVCFAKLIIQCSSRTLKI